MYHYLESPDFPNPFGDDYSRKYPGCGPLLRQLDDREYENIDPPEEVEWGMKMADLRNRFLHRLVSATEGERIDKVKREPQLKPGTFAAQGKGRLKDIQRTSLRADAKCIH